MITGVQTFQQNQAAVAAPSFSPQEPATPRGRILAVQVGVQHLDAAVGTLLTTIAALTQRPTPTPPTAAPELPEPLPLAELLDLLPEKLHQVAKIIDASSGHLCERLL